MRIFTLELNNDIKGINQRKVYIESLIQKLPQPDLVVLPELALCSYMGSDAIWQYADEQGKVAINWAIETAKKFHTSIAVGFLEQENNDIYNSYLIAGEDQVYGIVRKSEGESYLFKRGNFSNVIATPFGKVGVGICYDARRRHFYESIKEESLSLILFPHGSPSDPKKKEKELKTNNHFCNAYLKAFEVPVVYVNSIGKLDYMLGNTGKMMMNAGFHLNGYSKIYSQEGKSLICPVKEAIGIDVVLEAKKRKSEVRFYGKNIKKGNFLFRRLILKPDIKKGIQFYEMAKEKR